MAQLELSRWKAVAVTPVHVGGAVGKRLPFEYAQEGGTVFYIDEDRLAVELGQRGLLEPFMEYIRRSQRDASLIQFLREKQLLGRNFLDSVSQHQVASDETVTGEILVFERDGRGRAFLPGSSLKGALRVGVMYQLLKEAGERSGTQPLAEYVRVAMQDLRGRRRQFREKLGRGLRALEVHGLPPSVPREYEHPLDAWVLQVFRAPGGRQVTAAHRDPMRAVKVSDTRAFEDHEMQIAEVTIWNLWNPPKGPAEKTRVWAEVLRPGTEFEIRIAIDHFILKNMGTPIVGGVTVEPGRVLEVLRFPMTGAQTMAADLLAHEHQHMVDQGLGALPAGSGANFRVGWGGGLLGTSLQLLLDLPERRLIRDSVFVADSAPFRGQPAPLSRRLTTQGDLPLGWLKVEPVV